MVRLFFMEGVVVGWMGSPKISELVEAGAILNRTKSQRTGRSKNWKSREED